MPKTITTPKRSPFLSPRDISRFWSHVDVRGPDECWPWTAAIRKGNGYGCFVTKFGLYLAHRIAYYIQHQDDPGFLLVCHHCDNPPCCNGKHLFKGTNRDNSNDSRYWGFVREEYLIGHPLLVWLPIERFGLPPK